MMLFRSVEFGPQGLRVNCIAPGLIKTDFARALWENPDTLEISTRRSSLRRIGEPEEIAVAAVFLARRAGGFTPGQTIVLAGGNTSSGGCTWAHSPARSPSSPSRAVASADRARLASPPLARCPSTVTPTLRTVLTPQRCNT